MSEIGAIDRRAPRSDQLDNGHARHRQSVVRGRFSLVAMGIAAMAEWKFEGDLPTPRPVQDEEIQLLLADPSFIKLVLSMVHSETEGEKQCA